MKNKSKNQPLKKKKEFRFCNIVVYDEKGKKTNRLHPAYVFLQKGNLYIYVSLTHSKTVLDYLVIQLRKNPKPNDNRKSYWVAQVKQNTKDKFSSIKKGWKMNELDDEDIRKFFDKVTKKDDSADQD